MLRGEESLKYQCVYEPIPDKLTDPERDIDKSGNDHNYNEIDQEHEYYVQSSGENSGNRGERAGTNRILCRVRLKRLVEVVDDVSLEITHIYCELREHYAHRVTEYEIRFEDLLC